MTKLKDAIYAQIIACEFGKDARYSDPDNNIDEIIKLTKLITQLYNEIEVHKKRYGIAAYDILNLEVEE